MSFPLYWQVYLSWVFCYRAINLRTIKCAFRNWSVKMGIGQKAWVAPWPFVEMHAICKILTYSFHGLHSMTALRLEVVVFSTCWVKDQTVCVRHEDEMTGHLILAISLFLGAMWGTPLVHCDDRCLQDTVSHPAWLLRFLKVIGLCMVKITVNTGEFFHTFTSSFPPLLTECEPFPDSLWPHLPDSSGWNCWQCAFSYPVCFETRF